MTPKEKAQDLANRYRAILMNENTACGEEILCTTIAKKIALITIDEVQYCIDWLVYNLPPDEIENEIDYWNEVKREIENL